MHVHVTNKRWLSIRSEINQWLKCDKASFLLGYSLIWKASNISVLRSVYLSVGGGSVYGRCCGALFSKPSSLIWRPLVDLTLTTRSCSPGWWKITKCQKPNKTTQRVEQEDHFEVKYFLLYYLAWIKSSTERQRMLKQSTYISAAVDL